MNEPLTVEMRKRIAKACVPDTDWRIWRWEPERSLTHKDALVSKVAQLIEKRSNHEPTIGYLLRFNKALAENNVPEIERMAWELLENKE